MDTADAPLQTGTIALLGLLALLAIGFTTYWWRFARTPAANRDPARPVDYAIGALTNFFDTLGIGSFAPTTSLFKFLRRMRDEQIPGTLNAGHALPTVTQALVFITRVNVDFTTLGAMIAAAVAGAWLGAGVVTRMPRNRIQIGMGFALIVAATLFTGANLGWVPAGGVARGLSGWLLAIAVAVSFVLGALMTLGIGLYAPCLIMVSLMGLDPVVAFPIMMGSCAFLQPSAGMRFIARNRYHRGASIALTLGGIPAVLVAAYVVRSLPLEWLRWLVIVVVVIAAAMMLRSAAQKEETAQAIRPIAAA